MSSPIQLSQFQNGDESMKTFQSPHAEDDICTSSIRSPPPDYQRVKDESDTSSLSSLTSSIHQAGTCVPALQQEFLAAKQPVDIAHAKWYKGWKTILIVVASWLIGVVLGIGQLVLYLSLDGKAAANINESVDATFCFLNKHCTTRPYTSQHYITTVSVVFSNIIQYCLQISLGIAGTQYLWKILRNAALKIETIEALFNVRTNPLYVFNMELIRHGWVLILFTMTWWAIPFICSFPPGSITVKSISPNIPGFAMIPTFNASYTADETLQGLEDIAFSDITIMIQNTAGAQSDVQSAGPSVSWSTMLTADFYYSPVSLRQLAVEALINGKPLAIPSPCGPNCTYTYEFEGPSFNCSEETLKFIMPESDEDSLIQGAGQTIYSGAWSYMLDTFLLFEPAFLNISVVNLPEVPYLVDDLVGSNATILLTETRLSCIPYRSLYTVKNSYINDNQTINYNVTKIKPLPNYYDFTGPVNISGSIGGDTGALGGIQWSNESLSWFRDTQLMGMVNGMATMLNGTYVATFGSSFENFTLNSTSNASTFLYWSPQYFGASGDASNSLVPFSRFSNNFQDYTFPITTDFGPQINFTISEESLNRALGDYVISFIPAFAAWNQSLPVTRFPAHNVYWFSNPKQLTIPYGISFLLSSIMIAIGLKALHDNGIPANDGGIIQLMGPLVASERLRKAAAADCLGGDGENLSKELEGVRIKYGELFDMSKEVNGHLVRRAGFGVEDEIAPLIKGGKYGVVHEI